MENWIYEKNSFNEEEKWGKIWKKFNKQAHFSLRQGFFAGKKSFKFFIFFRQRASSFGVHNCVIDILLLLLGQLLRWTEDDEKEKQHRQENIFLKLLCSSRNIEFPIKHECQIEFSIRRALNWVELTIQLITALTKVQLKVWHDLFPLILHFLPAECGHERWTLILYSFNTKRILLIQIGDLKFACCSNWKRYKIHEYGNIPYSMDDSCHSPQYSPKKQVLCVDSTT